MAHLVVPAVGVVTYLVVPAVLPAAAALPAIGLPVVCVAALPNLPACVEAVPNPVLKAPKPWTTFGLLNPLPIAPLPALAMPRISLS